MLVNVGPGDNGSIRIAFSAVLNSIKINSKTSVPVLETFQQQSSQGDT